MSLDRDRYLKNAQGSEPHPSNQAAPQPEGKKEGEEEEELPQDEIRLTRKRLSRQINRIDIWTNNSVDNGLFEKEKKALIKKGIGDPDELLREIRRNLKEARAKLYEGDLPEAEYHASEALQSYDKALYATSRRWRFSNVYAGPMWIYLIGFLGAVLSFYWIFQLDINILGLNPPGVLIQEAALHAATWGTVGAILRGIWFLKDKVSDRRYRNSFRIYLLSTPFLGGLFGAIFYFLLVAGLVIVLPGQAPALLANQTSTGSNGSTTTTDQTESTTQANGASAVSVSSVAIIPFAALAGFNWEWAIMIFKRIGESFKGETEPEDKIER